jgi:hypothetical protein
MAVSKGAERITRAIEGALERLAVARMAVLAPLVGTAKDVTDALFATLGETPMWLIAFDDLLGKRGKDAYRARRNGHADGNVLLGLKIARNAVAHGDDVVQLASGSPGAIPGRASLPLVLGTVPSCLWASRPQLSEKRADEPQGPLCAKDRAAVEARLAREKSYDLNITGKEIFNPLMRAFAFLKAEAGT